MTKNQYAKCEEASKNIKNLPEYETLVKASQLLNDGSYWGPEAEATLAPSDINIDALKVQMKLFLKRYGEDVDLNDMSSDSFKDLVDRVVNQKTSEGDVPSQQNQVNETLVTFPDNDRI